MRLDPSQVLAVGAAAGIVGWVALEGVSGSLDGVEIEVEPRHGRSRREAAKRPKTEAKQRTKTDKRGLFQLHGLALGAYVIRAKKEPFALAMASVQVKPDRVTEVANPPLTLRKPQPLQIYVDPPIPPDGSVPAGGELVEDASPRRHLV